MMQNQILAALLVLAILDNGLASKVHRLGSRSSSTRAGRSTRAKGIKGAKQHGTATNNRGLKLFGGILKGKEGGDGREENEIDLPENVALEEEGEGKEGGGGREEQEIELPENVALEEDEDTGIIGGESASSGEYPFYAKFEGGTLCGGSLITPDTVLTAAHCVDSGKPNAVRIGADQYNNGGVVVNTQCSVMHEDFIENDKTLMNDVAIIKLKSPVTDASVSTIAYNSNVAYPSTPGTKLTVIGFGLTQNNGNVANTLQELTTDFVSIGECMQTYSEKVVTPEHHICADVQGAGDCNGDSGGPVFVNGLQVGIVSFGYGGCAAQQYQDVYVNVAAYSDWITSYALGQNCQPVQINDPAPAPAPDTSGGGTDTGGGGDDGSGSDVDTTDTDEEPSDFDSLMECFTTVLQVVQGIMGGDGLVDTLGGLGGGEDAKGGDDAKGGGGGGGGGGGQNKGGGEDKDAQKQNQQKGGAGGKQGGFLRRFFLGDNDEDGGLVDTILEGVHNVLSSPEVDTALGNVLEVEGDGGER